MKKKILSLVLVLGTVFVLTGCGNKPSTLVCSQKVSNINVEINANFAGNKVKSMGLKYDMDYSKYSDTYVETVSKQDFCKTVTSAMSSQFTLVDCKQTTNGKNIVIKSGIDISKLSSSSLTGSPSATKTELEKQGYSCTLK